MPVHERYGVIGLSYHPYCFERLTGQNMAFTFITHDCNSIVEKLKTNVDELEVRINFPDVDSIDVFTRFSKPGDVLILVNEYEKTFIFNTATAHEIDYREEY